MALLLLAILWLFSACTLGTGIASGAAGAASSILGIFCPICGAVAGIISGGLQVENAICPDASQQNRDIQKKIEQNINVLQNNVNTLNINQQNNFQWTSNKLTDIGTNINNGFTNVVNLANNIQTSVSNLQDITSTGFQNIRGDVRGLQAITAGGFIATLAAQRQSTQQITQDISNLNQNMNINFQSVHNQISQSTALLSGQISVVDNKVTQGFNQMNVQFGQVQQSIAKSTGILFNAIGQLGQQVGQEFQQTKQLIVSTAQQVFSRFCIQ